MGRPRIPDSVVWVAFRAIAKGATQQAAANLAGISLTTLESRLREEPVAALRDRKVRPGSLLLEEREEIRLGIERGETDEEIGVRLGRHRSTIWREIRANGGRDRYRAFPAQDRSDHKARRPKLTWIQQRPWLWSEVQALLRTKKWSPE